MIEATEQENTRALEDRRALQSEGTAGLLTGAADAGDGPATPRWRIRLLILSIAGLIVAAVMGGFILASKEKSSPTLAADSVLEQRTPVVGTADTAGEPTESVAPDASRTVGVVAKRTDEGMGTGAVPATPSDDPTVAIPVPEQATEKLGSGAEPRPGDEAAEARTPPEASPFDPTPPTTDMASEQPLPPKAPSSPQPAGENGPTIDRAKDHPVTMRIASIVFDVRMRAGPGNAHEVLATIPRGRSVEVIECRQWCEVIFRGQRGWVYERFIGPSSTVRRP